MQFEYPLVYGMLAGLVPIWIHLVLEKRPKKTVDILR